MRDLFSLLRRPAVITPLLCGVLMIPVLLTRSWATDTNYCPGSPWNCQVFDNCDDIWWCQDDPGDCGQTWQDHWWYRKNHKIKICTRQNPPGIVYCASCYDTTKTSDCCHWSGSEPTCPSGPTCP